MNSKTKIIEFFGLPKTGKTTSVNTLKKYLSSKGINTEIVIERASRCPVQNKLHPLFNYWTTFSLLKEFVDAVDRGVNILIADRGLIDSFIWINCLTEKNGYKAYLQDYKPIYNDNFLRKNIIKGYYFFSSIDTILDREFERQVIRNYGRIMNPSILRRYESTYSKLKDVIRNDFNITEVNTDIIAINDVVKIIEKEVDKLI